MAVAVVAGLVVVVVVVVRVVHHDDALGQRQHPAAVGGRQRPVGEHLVRRAERHQPIGQQHHPVGVARVGQVMSRQHDRAARRLLVGHGLEDQLARHDVEAGHRLVEQQQVGLLGQALRDEDPLALAARQFVELAPGQVGHAEALERTVDGGSVATVEPRERPLTGVARHGHGLPHGDRERTIHVGGLQDEGDGARRAPRGDLQAPVARRHQAGDGAQQGRLARAVGADQRHRRSGEKFEGGRGQRGPGAVGQHEIGGAHGGSGGCGGRCGHGGATHLVNREWFSLESESYQDPFSVTDRLEMLSRFRLNRKSAIALPLGASLALAATACGSDDDTAAGAGSGRPQLVVTTSVLGDVVENLVGDLADVEVVMPAGSSPHEFQASPRQVVAMREADAMIVNGGGFEEGLGDPIEAAEADGVATYAAIDAVETLTFAQDEPHDEDDAEQEDHGAARVDPHFFTDPRRVATAAQAIADFLADEVPALDAEMEATLAAVPADRRKLVTNHEVLGYFAQRYGFEVIGAVIPTGTTQAAPSAGELDELAHTIEEAGVPAIFAETSSPTRLADSLADEGGEVQVVELYTESLGPDGSAGDTYAGMMRSDAEQIADALSA